MGHSHGKRWTDELVKEKIYEVMRYYRIDRMPSRREIVDYCKNMGLAEKLGKIGYYQTAERLGLEIKKSDTGLGKAIEKYIIDLLTAKGHSAEHMSQNFPYDLLVDGIIKIDVKTSNLHHGSNGNFYTFSHEKKSFTCDFYIFVCLDDGEITDRIYVIPAYQFSKNTQFSIGQHNSKYNKYLQRFDLLSAFAENIKTIEKVI